MRIEHCLFTQTCTKTTNYSQTNYKYTKLSQNWLHFSKISNRAKKGAFKGASKDTKKALGKKAKEHYGNPEGWSKEDLDEMKDFIDEVPSKYLKKVPKDVVRNEYRSEFSVVR